MISVFAQIVQRLPGHLIEGLARGQGIKAREFSCSSQLDTLMLGQFLFAFSLNELVDISEVHREGLSRIRGISPMPPDFVIIDSARRHDSTKALALTEGLKAGDVVIGDRGYFDFNWFREMDEIGVQFVSREKVSLRCKAVESVPTDDLGDGIVSDEIWLKKDLDKLLQLYGTAPPVVSTASARNIPYLPGFEKAYLKAVGQQTA